MNCRRLTRGNGEKAGEVGCRGMRIRYDALAMTDRPRLPDIQVSSFGRTEASGYYLLAKVMYRGHLGNRAQPDADITHGMQYRISVQPRRQQDLSRQYLSDSGGYLEGLYADAPDQAPKAGGGISIGEQGYFDAGVDGEHADDELLRVETDPGQAFWKGYGIQCDFQSQTSL